MPGTEIGYAAAYLLCDVRYWYRLGAVRYRQCLVQRCIVLRVRYAMSGAEREYGAYAATRLLDGRRAGAIRLPTCYAMSGTDVAYAAMSLRACYAMSSADTASGPMSLRSCYAVSGSDLAYAAICSLRACYAISGTDERTSLHVC
eukprot:1885436-Rhodomonas_salina.2